MDPALLQSPLQHVQPYAVIFGAQYDALCGALTQMQSAAHGYSNMFKLRSCWGTVVRQHFSSFPSLLDSDFYTYQQLVFGAGGTFPEQPLQPLNNNSSLRISFGGKGGIRAPSAPKLDQPRVSETYMRLYHTPHNLYEFDFPGFVCMDDQLEYAIAFCQEASCITPSPPHVSRSLTTIHPPTPSTHPHQLSSR